MTNNIHNILPAPTRPTTVPSDSKWLSGEGAGSWFSFRKSDAKDGESDLFQIVRYSPEGLVECDNLFTTSAPFNINEAFELNYLSHCAEVNITQGNKKIKFTVQVNLNI